MAPFDESEHPYTLISIFKTNIIKLDANIWDDKFAKWVVNIDTGLMYYCYKESIDELTWCPINNLKEIDSWLYKNGGGISSGRKWLQTLTMNDRNNLINIAIEKMGALESEVEFYK